ncbi:MAG: sulfocyanin-like copper-binding protein [Candidatus Limnocylindrales bacterium]
MRGPRTGVAGAALVVVGIILIAVGAVAGGTGTGWFGAQRAADGSGGSGGASGWGIGGMGPGMLGFGARVARTPVASGEAASLGAEVPAGATLDRASNTITFSGTTVALTVLASPSDGQDETFRMAGLTNPTLVMPRGAQVTLQLINADAGMPHNWLIMHAQPPFPYMVRMAGPVAFGAVTPTLAEAGASGMPSARITFVASVSGRYSYLCSVPGHAQAGMYGGLVVGA